MLAKAAIAIVPLALAGLASAAPMSTRTNNIQCEKSFSEKNLFWDEGVDGATGGFTALLTSSENGSYFLSLARNEAAQRYALSTAKFNFHSCKSDYMGYVDTAGTGAETFFGHLVGAHDAQPEEIRGKCLTARADVYATEIGATEFDFVDCREADNEEQLRQFFQLRYEKYLPNGELNSNGSAFLQYIGVQRKDDGTYGNQAPPVFQYELKQESNVAAQRLSGHNDTALPKIYMNI